MSVVIVASPPYAATEIITARAQETPRGARGAMRQTEGRRYGRGDGNLANLKPGDSDKTTIFASQENRNMMVDENEVNPCQTVRSAEKKLSEEVGGVENMPINMSAKFSKAKRNRKASRKNYQKPNSTSQCKTTGENLPTIGLAVGKNGGVLLGQFNDGQPSNEMGTNVSDAAQLEFSKFTTKKAKSKPAESGTMNLTTLKQSVPDVISGNTNQNSLTLSEPDTFWNAARTIVAQSHAVLKDGAYCAWVVKSFVRNKSIVDFPAQWRALCEHCGFETVECIRAGVVEDQGARLDFDGKVYKKVVTRKSFFRRLHEKKYPETAIDYEVVWIMRKAVP